MFTSGKGHKTQRKELIRGFHISSTEIQVSGLTTQQTALFVTNSSAMLSREHSDQAITHSELLSPGQAAGASSQLFLFQRTTLYLHPYNNLHPSGMRMNTERVSGGLIQPWLTFVLQGDHHLKHAKGTLRRALSFQAGDRS